MSATEKQPEELNIADLNSAVGTESGSTKEKKPKKEFTAEDLANLEAGVAKMQEFGVTENLAKVLPLLLVWHLDAEAQKATKEEVAAAFGGTEKLKDYADAGLAEDLGAFTGMQKAISTLNNVKSFYARRSGSGTKSAKIATAAITISGEPYTVSAAYLTEIAAEPRERKIELLLAHPATKKNDAIETL